MKEILVRSLKYGQMPRRPEMNVRKNGGTQREGREEMTIGVRLREGYHTVQGRR